MHACLIYNQSISPIILDPDLDPIQLLKVLHTYALTITQRNIIILGMKPIIDIYLIHSIPTAIKSIC